MKLCVLVVKGTKSMTKAAFFQLLEKYENGQCSNAETKALFAYCEQLQAQNFAHSWTLSEREAAKIRLLNRINASIQETATPNKRVFPFRIPYAVAALCIIALLSGAYVFWQAAPTAIPANAITLELEDGSIQVLQENQTLAITNSQGATVGQQQGNTLQYNAPAAGSETSTFNTLRVPYGKTFQVALSDGTQVHLNAGSSIHYPVRFAKNAHREVTITGEAYLQVAKDSLHPFVVGVDNTYIRVLGTEFNVSSYPEDAVTEVTLVEGLVALYPQTDTYAEAATEKLHPGYKAMVNKETHEITQAAVLTSLYTSWMRGEMVFRNMSFENILKKLERKYDVVITNKNKVFQTAKFNASFGSNVSLTQVLSELQQMYGIQYQIEGNQIQIY